jgi:hypothetical protein
VPQLYLHHRARLGQKYSRRAIESFNPPWHHHVGSPTDRVRVHRVIPCPASRLVKMGMVSGRLRWDLRPVVLGPAERQRLVERRGVPVLDTGKLVVPRHSIVRWLFLFIPIGKARFRVCDRPALMLLEQLLEKVGPQLGRVPLVDGEFGRMERIDELLGERDDPLALCRGDQVLKLRAQKLGGNVVRFAQVRSSLFLGLP